MVEGTDARPRLRGVLHQAGAALALIAGIALVAWAPSARAAWACALFAGSLTAQMTVSAVYHRILWSPIAYARMRRADHAAIFVLIAGSASPFALLSMPADLGDELLLLFWGGAAVGIAVTMWWTARPRWLIAVLCVVLGWAGAPIWLDKRSELDRETVMLLVSTGIIYSVGALCYALKRPRLWRATFSYHELFHAFTLVAAVVNFCAVARVAARAVP
ncbi:MAG TPA: hemolysin III family protein [Myxococcota bacterium]